MVEKNSWSVYKKISTFFLIACIWAPTISACASVSALHDSAGPTIDQITSSSKGFSIDCAPTSITVTAHITDTLGVARVTLWYRVGTDQPYTSRNMDVSNHVYSATIKGIDLPAGPYGTLGFYITAEDTAGNKSQSPLDTSVEFLPCVSS